MKQLTTRSRSENDSTEFSFGPTSPFADKSEYVDKKLLFTIREIELEIGRGFEGADRWSVTVEPDDERGTETLTFGCNKERDRQFSSARKYIAARGPISGVRLKKSGNAYYLETARGAVTH